MCSTLLIDTCKLILALLVVFLLSGCGGKVEIESKTVSTETGDVVVTTLTNRLKRPWSLAVMPDGNLLITEKSGALKLFDLASARLRDIKGVPKVTDKHRGGLFDVVLHPDFNQQPWVYLSYNVKVAEDQYSLRLGRGRLVQGGIKDWQVLFTTTLAASPVVANPKHFGGGLAISSDGSLYMSIGDRYSRPKVQKMDNYIGKVIHLELDGGVPESNPWVVEQDVLPEIFSVGLRNPQSMTADNQGRVWLVDHGPLGGDELNLAKPKANYGWPVVSGGTEYNGRVIGEGTHKDGMDQPIHTWPESVAPSGITFYDGDLIPQWKNNLFISCLIGTQIKRLELKEGQIVHEEILLQDLKIRFRDIIAGFDGNIYILAEDGRLFEVSPSEVGGEK